MSTAMATDSEHNELVPLGTGPAATVLAGVDETTGQAYALKVYPGRPDRRTRTALDRELAVLDTLRPLGTVLVPDGLWELADGRFTVRMELCAQSLTELIGAFGPLSVDDTVALGQALAEALAGAHRAGLVHGGVTPGNVLFRASGTPVLSDFGRTLRTAFPRDSVLGTDFLAPETVRDGSADERTDLYGLGAVLYFALSGRSPHQGRPGEPADQLALRVLSDPVPVIERADIPPGLRHLVSVLLDKNPDARAADAAMIAGRLASMSGPDLPPPVPVHPRPLGRPILEYGPQTAPTRRKPRTALVVAAVAGVAVLTAATVLLLNRPSELVMPQSGAAPAPTVPAPPTTSPGGPPASPARIDLDDPVDRGNFVELTWHSSVQPMDFAVLIAPEGEPNKDVLVQRSTSYRVDVDPGRKYCFSIQGADTVGVYESTGKGIRGATCVQ